MIPSLIVINTGKKRMRFLTFKKTLIIGTGEDADLIVNHPYLQDRSQTLVVGDPVKSVGKREGEDIDGGMVQWAKEAPDLQIRCWSLKLPFALAAVTLVATVLLALVLRTVPGESGTQDWSAIPLPAKEAYGFNRLDDSHPDGVIYSFEAQVVEPHRLTFVPGGKGDGSTLSLSVNQNPPLNSIKLPEGWGMERLIRIPAEMIREGENAIEFRHFSQSPETGRWGIREVKLIRIVESPMDQTAIRQMLESAGALLKKQALDGSNLGRLYGILNEISIPNHLFELNLSRKSLLDTVQSKMIKKLREIALQVKSARNMGDEEAAGKLATRTRDWVPEGWEEGRRILNDL
jgi:hypothetical protein